MTWDEAKTRVEQMLAEVEEYVAAQHKAGIPDDDGWELDAEALRLLLSHAIPREDRERALDLAWRATINFMNGIPDPYAEARRLLKLEAEP